LPASHRTSVSVTVTPGGPLDDPPLELPEELPEEEPDDDPDEDPEDESEEDPDDEESQHPSPRARTSHLRLSA
jgi:hypothetical protein